MSRRKWFVCDYHGVRACINTDQVIEVQYIERREAIVGGEDEGVMKSRLTIVSVQEAALQWLDAAADEMWKRWCEEQGIAGAGIGGSVIVMTDEEGETWVTPAIEGEEADVTADRFRVTHGIVDDWMEVNETAVLNSTAK